MKTNLTLLTKFIVLIFTLLLTSLSSFAQFRVVGYLPTWAGDLNAVQYTKLTHINYAFLIPTSNGGYQAPDDPTRLKNLVTQAHANGVKVIISVGGGGGGDAFKTIVPNSTYRTNFVNNMVSFANQYNLDGVDIDWEFPSDGTEANNFLLLIQQLSTAMHNNGKLCTMAVVAYGGTSIVNGIFSAVDFLNIMAYDENNYQHSTYDLGVQSVNYWVGRGLPASKAVLGVPFYGRDNCCDYKTVGYNDILAMGGSPNSDTYNNEIGYNGIPTMKQKTAYAMQACSGIMIWSLDTDAQGANSLLSAINSVVVANSNPVPDNLAKGKPVTVSSTEVNSTTSTAGSNATDGSYSTRWSSLFADPQWISVDLGANYNINRVKISWEAAFASAYQIQISSDGTNWNTIKSVTGNTSTTNDQTGLSGTGRYVRIYGTARATAYGYSIYEIEVYGTAIESPFSGTAISLPGKIEAENYDLGGQGLAYNDADAANQGGAYRTDGVDVQATTDVGGGYNVGYIADGEWLNYMVNVTSAGTYNFSFRTASTGSTGAIQVNVDGAAVTGSIAIPNTGAWQTWTNVSSPNISLSAGQHTIRLLVVTGGFNLNYVNVTTVAPNQAPTVSLTSPVSGASFTSPANITISANAADADGTVSKVDFYNGTTLLSTVTTAPYNFTWTNVATGTYSITAKATDNSGASTTSAAANISVTAPVIVETPYGGTAISLPGKIEAENYDNGGEGLAYHDVDVTNQGGAYRTDGVDIQATTDVGGGYNVGYIADGEWMNYMVNVTTTGIYNFNFRTASTGSAGVIQVKVDGAAVTGSIAVPNTGAWQTWTTVASPNISLSAGKHTIQLFVVTGGFNINYVNVVPNQAPTVSLTSPASGASFTSPANITLSANAADTDGTVSKVDFYNGTTLLSTVTTAPYNFIWTNVAAGAYSITAKATDNSGAVTTSGIVTISVIAETPYGGTAISLPGKIEAENYDNGGEGLAYHDADVANQGGAYRTDGVDVQATTDVGGGYNVGYIADGEWMNYMVNVTATGVYYFNFRVASTGSTGAIRVDVDGAAATGSIAIPNTGAWQTWTSVSSPTISLSAGQHTIRLFVVTGGFNINYVNVAPNQAPSISLTSPASGASFTSPANIVLSANAADADGTVSKVDFYNGTTLLSTVTTAPYNFTWTNVATGTYSITAKATDNSGASTTSSTVNISVTTPVIVETPYGGTAINLPGKIEAENYDNGGEGIAYHDVDVANQGGAYRTDGVDVQATTDVGGGYNVGYIADGEWMKYTVNVTTAGTYNIDFRTAATSASGVLQMEIDGVNVTGSVSIPNTGAWQTWSTTTVSNIAFTAGTHVIRLYVVTGGFNINNITVSVPSANPGFLHASGKNIVNNKGNFIIKAINIGDFMIQEGYMLNLSGSQHIYRQKIADMIGTAARDQFYANYYANFITKADIDSIAKWGFNTIRLPMHYQLFTPLGQPTVFLDQGFTIVDNIVSWCKANNIYVILDLHAAPGGENSGDISDYDSSQPSLWESAANRDQTVKLWAKIASRYVNEQYVGGYDLINETNWTLANNNALLAQLMKDITTAIRQVDQNHILFIEGNSYANDYNGLTPKWDNNMAYSFHKYWNDDSQSSLNFVLSIRDGQNVPIWMGEFGENSNNWIADAVTLMNQNGIGWAIWPYKKMSSVSSVSSFKQPSNWSAFANFVDGGAQPSAAAGQAILNELLEDIKVSNCTVNKGYLYALFQQPGNTNTIPFAKVSLPGRVTAANYDEGKEGYAYNDAAYQNTQYGSTVGSSTNWNTGWYYRNDGVDLQYSTAENAPTVGWTENGDWMQYTVNITTSGSYTVKVRVAGNGGTLSLSEDGTTLINSATIPATGGWDTWQTISLGNVNLSAGSHKLRFTVNTAGYNLSYYDFSTQAGGANARVGDLNDVSTSATVNKNLLVPNPTSGIVNIAVSSSFSVQVLNSYGEEVLSVDEVAANGSIDMTRLSAGVYFVKIISGEGSLAIQKIVKQ